MKIEKLHLIDHPFFGTIDIGLTDQEGKPLDTVVFAWALLTKTWFL